MKPKFKIGDKVQFIKTKVNIGQIEKIEISEFKIRYSMKVNSLHFYIEDELELYEEPKKVVLRYQYIYQIKNFYRPTISVSLFLDDEDFKNVFDSEWFKKLPTPFECES